MPHVDPAVSSGSSPTPKLRSKKSAAPVSPISNPAPTIPLRSRHALTVPQAAVYLSVTNWWIEELIRNGKIPFRTLDNGSNESVRLLDCDDLDLVLTSTPKQRVLRIEKGTAITECAA
jgi:excisionase family DNA binding protein